MTSKEKKVIFSIVGILVIILLIVILVKTLGKEKEVNGNTAIPQTNTIQNQNDEKYTSVLDDGTKINDSQEFNKAKKYKDMQISDIQFTTTGGNSVLLANVKNTGSTTHEPEIVIITVLGDNNEVITTLEAVIPKIEPGQSKQLNTIVTADFVNAKDFKIEAK